jgi:ribonuclease BN (tRNA processing enzyme)
MRLIPLGAGGYMPAGRHTMSFLLDSGDDLLLLDAGTGMARLLEPALAERLGRHRGPLDILLSHYHVDHVIGLTYLLAVWTQKPVRLFGPAPPLTDGRPEEALRRMFAPPLFPLTLETLPNRIEIREIDAELPGLEFLGLPVRLRRQRHPGGSAGIRLGDLLAYVTDTAFDPATAEFARGVEWLLHEVWVSDREAEAVDPGAHGHIAAGKALDIALAAGVRHLMPIHHHPKRGAEGVRDLAAAMAQRAAGRLEVVLPEEGLAIELHGG